jgi:hypothetical protein
MILAIGSVILVGIMMFGYSYQQNRKLMRESINSRLDKVIKGNG